jgi:D-threo-aldose 1-dehydrogenase
MRTVELGRTNLMASRLGFGLSGLHHLLSSRGRQSLLAAAYDHGINYFDTAPYYGHGLAERELGRFAAARRAGLIITTKFGIEPINVYRRFPTLMYAGLAVRKLSPSRPAKRLARTFAGGNPLGSVERSLRALRVERIDILYLHEPAMSDLCTTDTDELHSALDKLRAQGKIGYVGLSGSAADCAAIARGHPRLAEVMQIDAARGAADLAPVREAALAVHASFGHFRGASGTLLQRAAAAVDLNRNGIILFSSRRVDHLKPLIDVVTSADDASSRLGAAAPLPENGLGRT